MGYDIYIGETVLTEVSRETEYSVTFEGKRRYFAPFIHKTTERDAPVFTNDNMTLNSNARHPSSDGWEDFTKQAGLYDLFMHPQTGLMATQPGYAPLKEEHGTAITEALKRWQAAHPGAIPGFNKDDETVVFDPILARLLWLDWWVSWALENCETPGIYNF